MKVNNDRNVPGRENKPHIGIFGRCNSGKSTLLNFIVGAEAAITSPERGTTTDVVRRNYEILDFAPVVFIDTAGTDDSSAIAGKRVGRTMDAIAQVDLALLIFDKWTEEESRLAAIFEKEAVPFIPVLNLFGGESSGAPAIEALGPGHTVIAVDAAGSDQAQHERLMEEIKRLLPEKSYKTPSMFEGLAAEGDIVLLVCPIDSEAPAGRLILPQVQAIRELLDRHAAAVVVQPSEIGAVFARGAWPSLVVCDSQAYGAVRAAVPPQIEVTSFSILLAAAKGDYELYLKGLERVDELRDGDRVLIAENCSHQVSCEDIGRVKIPSWLGEYTGKNLSFSFVSGLAPLPDDLANYALVVQCGGCMVTRSQLQRRIRRAEAAGVPVTNYGMLIRKLQGGK